MDKQKLSPQWFAAVTRVDTPTICNALELVLGKRQATGFTYGTPVAAPAPLPAIAGYARTLRFSAAQPSAKPADEALTQRIAYFRYVQPKDGVPVILVMEDVDERPGIGSYWGEVNSTLHKALGLQGVLTNGSVRDLDVLAPNFPIIAGSIGPSHAHAHIVDFDIPVKVFGLDIAPGDLLHADRHGAVIIPEALTGELLRCIDLTIAKEAPLLEAARQPGFSVADIEQALKVSADIH